MIFRLRLRLFPARRAPRATATPTRQQRARRVVLWGVFAVLFAQIGLAVAVETVLPQVRDPEYGYHQVRATAQQKAHPDRPLVLVLGTSRTQNAIDPSSMGFPDEPGAPLVFNAALSGSWPNHLRLALQRYRAAGIRPAAVLVEVFAPPLSMSGPADPLFAKQTSQLTAADLRRLDPYLSDPAPLYRGWALTRANSWHESRKVIVSHLAPTWQPMSQRVNHIWHVQDYNGFLPYPDGIVTKEYRERKRAGVQADYEHTVRNVTVSAFTDRVTRDLIADCRVEGIAVAFYFPPESPIFRGWYTPESRAALSAFARTLSGELGCPVFEAPLDFAEEDFADGHHMLPTGARRFSRWLADAHLKPWLAGALK